MVRCGYGAAVCRAVLRGFPQRSGNGGQPGGEDPWFAVQGALLASPAPHGPAMSSSSSVRATTHRSSRLLRCPQRLAQRRRWDWIPCTMCVAMSGLRIDRRGPADQAPKPGIVRCREHPRIRWLRPSAAGDAHPGRWSQRTRPATSLPHPLRPERHPRPARERAMFENPPRPRSSGSRRQHR